MDTPEPDEPDEQPNWRPNRKREWTWETHRLARIVVIVRPWGHPSHDDRKLVNVGSNGREVEHDTGSGMGMGVVIEMDYGWNGVRLRTAMECGSHFRWD